MDVSGGAGMAGGEWRIETFLRDTFYPAAKEIIAWHRRGTWYGIGVDPEDHLLRAGNPGTQLTWMDAKVGDWVVTPRDGKAGRDQCAVAWGAEAGGRVGGRSWAMRGADFRDEADRVRESFRAKFWNRGAGVPVRRDCTDQGR